MCRKITGRSRVLQSTRLSPFRVAISSALVNLVFQNKCLIFRLFLFRTSNNIIAYHLFNAVFGPQTKMRVWCTTILKFKYPAPCSDTTTSSHSPAFAALSSTRDKFPESQPLPLPVHREQNRIIMRVGVRTTKMASNSNLTSTLIVATEGSKQLRTTKLVEKRGKFLKQSALVLQTCSDKRGNSNGPRFPIFFSFYHCRSLLVSNSNRISRISL
ncbi:hypothetical protein EDD21DRAFT_183742 [Dissophora ornata]|nr:hypothetical protein EDD21DRAFT_183742 [Dissophora ornata]